VQPDSVGERIRHLRIAQGLTQVQLAAHAGISQGLVSLIESGTRQGKRIYFETAWKIAKALHVSLDELAGC
jgi:transcriptional regulator with XRE-family HTH domain